MTHRYQYQPCILNNQQCSKTCCPLTCLASCQTSPVRSYLNVEGHFHIEKVLVIPQVARHLMLGVRDVPLQLTYPHLEKGKKANSYSYSTGHVTVGVA